MVKTTPRSRWKYLSYDTKHDGRKGWKVQYGGKQLISLAKFPAAKACLQNLLVQKGVIRRNDPLPPRVEFRKKATKQSKTQGVCLDQARGLYRGVSFSVGYHRKESDVVAAVKTAVRKHPADECSENAHCSMHGEPKNSSLSAAELRRRLPLLIAWGELPSKSLINSNFPEDVVSAMRHARSSAKLYVIEPCARPLSLQMKYEPMKEAFRAAGVQSSQEHPKVLLAVRMPHNRSEDYSIMPAARARRLRSVLVAMVKHLSQHPWPAEYQMNCNRYRERESGPLRVLHDLMIIKKQES